LGSSASRASVTVKARGSFRPSEQANRISAGCERDGMTFVDTLEELDVSVERRSCAVLG
jgi:hypothetical protein